MREKVVNKMHNKPFDLYIGRGSIWGNPYTSKPLANTRAEFQASSKEESIRLYRKYLVERVDLVKKIPELKGKVLGCYCKPSACHGDVLVTIAYFIDFIFNTGVEITINNYGRIGKVVKDPKYSFLHDCENPKCYQIHLKVIWEDDTITTHCITSFRKKSATTAVLIKEIKPVSLFNL